MNGLRRRRDPHASNPTCILFPHQCISAELRLRRCICHSHLSLMLIYSSPPFEHKSYLSRTEQVSS
jgi:hypothetical protein